MDIVLLKTFMSVVEKGSLSAAALDMNCVQSNITARIRRLESHLGQPVFVRGRGGAALTEYGHRVRDHAEDLIARFEAAEHELLDLAGKSAPLRLGAMETTAATRLPKVLKELKQRTPRSSISLQTGATGDLLSKIWERKIDAAFVAGPVDENRFKAIRVFEEELVKISARNSEPTSSLLAFGSACSYRAAAERWLYEEGKSDTEISEMGSLDGILGCVVAGMGFAVAPRSAAERYNDSDNLEFTKIPLPYSKVDTYLILRLDHRPSFALRELIAMLSSEI